MLVPVASRRGKKKPQSIIVDKFSGVVTAYQETRIEKAQAKEAVNKMLTDNGSWKERWGTKIYTIDMGATIDGWTEYIKTDGTRELIVVAGGKLYKVDEAALTKTEVNAAITYTAGKKVYFLQIANILYIGNGSNYLTRYDGSTTLRYSGLSTPTALTNTLSGIGAGTNNLYYRVSAANAIGETLATAELTVSVNKLRDLWVSGDSVNLTWTASAGAVKYIIYVDDVSGYGKKLGESNTNAFKDDGSFVPNPYVQPAINDTTVGPKLAQMCLAGNRIWGIEGEEGDNPWTVYWTGAGVYLGNFAPAFGGGWVRLEYGGRSRLAAIKNYQNSPKILGNTPDGKGDIWKVDLQTQEIDGTAFTVPVPEKIIGGVGTDAPRTVSEVENDVLYLNPSRVTVLGNEPGVLATLRVNEISRFIRTTILNINQQSRSKSCAYYYQQKWFLSIPTGVGDPDEIWVFDRERTTFYGPWTIGVTQFGEFTDNTASKVTHFLGSIGSKLVEFSEDFEGDDGVAFEQRYTSGLLPVSTDMKTFGKMKEGSFRLERAKGSVTVSIYGTNRKDESKTLFTKTYELAQASGTSGIGHDLIGDFLIGLTNGELTIAQGDTIIKNFKIKGTLRDIQIGLRSTDLSDRWTLTKWQIDLRAVRKSAPSQWRR